MLTAPESVRTARPESLAGTLELAGEGFLARLPPVSTLAADALALLAVARHAGKSWPGASEAAGRLLHEALVARRADFARAFLGQAQDAQGRGFLRHLAERGDQGLLRALERAAGEPWGAAELAPWAASLRDARERAARGSREGRRR